MSGANPPVTRHYASGAVLERIEAALIAVGVDSARPTTADLAPLDNLHGRGVIATREQIAAAGITANMHVLDIGCGIGGPARVMAEEVGCRVTGIDLTLEFIEVACELTRRCGMAGQVEFDQGDATALPYDDEKFDHVYCHNVTMNIADKSGLAHEIARVLKVGGRYSCAEVAQGPTGPPHFPLPWSREPEGSFLVSPEEMRVTLETAGLKIIEYADITEVYLRTDAPRLQTVGSPPLLNAGVVLGDDMRERVKNSARSSAEGRLIDQCIIAEKI